MPIDRVALIQDLCRISLQAGAAIMVHYANGVTATKKDDNSPVTIADQDAERIILDGLARVAPGIPVVSEEQASEGNIPEIADCFFLVDPLDGTKEFLNKNGEFTVNIALIENRVPTAGVVYAPAKDRLFYASGPGAAFELTITPNAEGSLTSPHEPKAIAVRQPDDDGLIIVASRTHRDHKTEEYLNHYKVKEFLAAGSSLKFCLIAAGEADLYPRHGRTMEWDTAAGHAVLAAAGGSVKELDGKPLLYGKSERGLDNPFFVARGGA
ncbi:MAG: 3'(2'),5'-bisphosphate nucleotidase CysQ [Parvibaculum sp.]|nr:3'(2'),5'-bisphosphate nucleotidase CysQ [Parvibaculum sp.]|tara:strand:- start:972 stop:1775 length:804 start_codon:yes stop_codon:yes gene_type:complete